MSLTEKTDIRDSDEKVVEIEMERLKTFTNHPFKVIGDSQMIELQDSIKKYGVLNPLIVRPRKEGYYEIISGHRRKYAYKATQAIRNLSDKDKASIPIIAMTANAFEEDKRDAIAAGMNGHIAKPIQVDKLLSILSEVIRKQSLYRLKNGTMGKTDDVWDAT